MSIAFVEEEDCVIYRAWVVVDGHDRDHGLHKFESDEQYWGRLLMVFAALDGNQNQRSANDITERQQFLHDEIQKLVEEEHFAHNTYPSWKYQKRVSVFITPTHTNISWY